MALDMHVERLQSAEMGVTLKHSWFAHLTCSRHRVALCLARHNDADHEATVSVQDRDRGHALAIGLSESLRVWDGGALLRKMFFEVVVSQSRYV